MSEARSPLIYWLNIDYYRSLVLWRTVEDDRYHYTLSHSTSRCPQRRTGEPAAAAVRPSEQPAVPAVLAAGEPGDDAGAAGAAGRDAPAGPGPSPTQGRSRGKHVSYASQKIQSYTWKKRNWGGIRYEAPHRGKYFPLYGLNLAHYVIFREIIYPSLTCS